MQVFANIRSIKNFSIKNSFLNSNEVDTVVVRELIPGVYFGKPKKRYVKNNQCLDVDTCRYSENEIKRVVKLAFEIAKNRRKFLVSVDKANVLQTSKLWKEIVLGIY